MKFVDDAAARRSPKKDTPSPERDGSQRPNERDKRHSDVPEDELAAEEEETTSKPDPSFQDDVAAEGGPDVSPYD